MPISAYFTYGKRMQLCVNGGAYFGYWLKGKVLGRTPDIFSVQKSNLGLDQQEIFQLVPFDEGYVFKDERDRRFEFGYLASIGLRYGVTKKTFG